MIDRQELADTQVQRKIFGTDDEVLDVVGATITIVESARQRQNLAETVTMTVTVPFNPPMRPLFEAAEPMLAQAYIELDWSLWTSWTVGRDLLDDDWDPAPFIQPVRGEYRIAASRIALAMRTGQAFTPEQARIFAAKILAAADLAERLQAQALEGGTRR